MIIIIKYILDVDEIRKVGWILYNEDIKKGLSSEITLMLIETLAKINNDGQYIYTDADLEKSYDNDYDDGFSAAKDMYDVECDCCC